MYRLNSLLSLTPPTKPTIRNYKEEIKNILNFIGLDNFLSQIKGLFSFSVEAKNEIKNTEQVVPEEQAFRYFNPIEMLCCCFKLTEWLVKTSNYKEINRARVENFKLLYQGLKESPTGKAFFKFEEGTVPYVFPFLLNNSEDFHYIRSQGIQILRWEEFYQTSNRDIESYRKRLIQIPCHQNLSKHEIDKIIAIINKENKSYVK